MSEKGIISVPDKMAMALDVPDSSTPDHDLLVLNATQGALGLRMRAAEIVGMAERSRATAYTIGAVLADAANLLPIPGGRYVSHSNIEFFSSIMHDAAISFSAGRPLDGIGQLVFGPPLLTALDMIENPIGGILRTVIGIGGVALTGLALAHWLNVGNVMRRALEYEPAQTTAKKS